MKRCGNRHNGKSAMLYSGDAVPAVKTLVFRLLRCGSAGRDKIKKGKPVMFCCGSRP